jgi:hypothetical protein
MNGYSRYTGLEVNIFVLLAVKACSGVYEYGRNMLGFLRLSLAQNTIDGTVSAIWGLGHDDLASLN